MRRVRQISSRLSKRVAGNGLNAGCLRLDAPVRPAQDAPLNLEGSPVRE